MCANIHLVKMRYVKVKSALRGSYACVYFLWNLMMIERSQNVLEVIYIVLVVVPVFPYTAFTIWECVYYAVRTEFLNIIEISLSFRSCYPLWHQKPFFYLTLVNASSKGNSYFTGEEIISPYDVREFIPALTTTRHWILLLVNTLVLNSHFNVIL